MSSHCAKCGKPLEVVTSVLRGLGPKCAAEIEAELERLEAENEDRFDLEYNPFTMDIEVRRDRVRHFNIYQVFRHHSPTGMEWGSLKRVVDLDMAIRAHQGEPFRVEANFAHFHAPVFKPFHPTVQVVKMQGRKIPFIPAHGALSTERQLQSEAFGPFLVTPSLLCASTALSFPSLVSRITEEGAALRAESVALNINAGAPVFFFRSSDLAALGATSAFPKAVSAISGLAVFSVRDVDTAIRAVQWWIRSHKGMFVDNLVDYYTMLENYIQKRYEGGPADFALNILAMFIHGAPRTVELWDGQKVPRLVWDLHQPFKWQFIATLDKKGGKLSGKEIMEWINGRKAERAAKKAA